MKRYNVTIAEGFRLLSDADEDQYGRPALHLVRNAWSCLPTSEVLASFRLKNQKDDWDAIMEEADRLHRQKRLPE